MTRPDRLCLALAAGLFLAAQATDQFRGWIDATVLPPLATELSREVRDRDGRLLRAFQVADGRWRLATTAAEVDPLYLEMLLAFEDRRFATHSGIDMRAMLRATGQAVAHGHVVSGASTLTMQVARLIEAGPTGRWSGKLRQIRVALALERRLDKGQILNLYLLRAPFGGNLEGVHASARAWFGKPPARLTPAEAALLVALPQSPERRRPDRAPKAAQRARDRVIERALQLGRITADTAASASNEPVPTIRRPFPRLAPHLADRLLAGAPRHGPIATTIDARLQATLESLADRTAREAGARLSVALLVADIHSGEILASVGSAAYAADGRNGFIDMTRAIRSPGSTLKPLIYGLAFDLGIAHPEMLILDQPTGFDGYAPQNFDGMFRGPVTTADALQQSLNIPAVKLTEALGPARLLAGLDRAGVMAELPGSAPPGLAIALGGLGVTLTDLTQLYAGLANGGAARALHSTPMPEPGAARRIIGPEAAWQVEHALAGIAPPEGSRRSGLAYKTGTSYGHRDAWALGWDGDHVIGVWMGRADGTPVPGAFGGTYAAPVLFEAFARLKSRLTPFGPAPAGTLMASGTALPVPLRLFRGDGQQTGTAGPTIAFPPEGARMAPGTRRMVVKLRDGMPPFTLLANGRPVALGLDAREFWVPAPERGQLTLAVIDALGQSARSTVQFD